jgi:hypothetical protein
MRRICHWCVALSVVLAGVHAQGNGLPEWPVHHPAQEAFGPASDTSGLVVRANDSGCTDCDAGCADECGCVGNWLDNTEVFLGGDAYAALGDFPAGGFGNSFGLVSGFNTGFGLGDLGIRGQFGASYGFYDFKGRAGGEPNSLEEQFFLTGGIYRRADMASGERFSWGMVLDGMTTDNWGINANELDLAQFRGIAGWAINECNELGLWGTSNLSDDLVVIGGATPIVRAMKQVNAYWKHNWEFGCDSMVYVGAIDSADIGDWVFGFTGRAPLSHRAGLYGGFNYVTPSTDTGALADPEDAWNVHFGLVFYLGGKAVSPTVAGDPGLPLLPVANNGSFLVTN